MTESDLQQLRSQKWRLDGKPIRTIEEARAFVEAVGFCLMYPVRPTMPVPTFIGAFVGSDNRLPTWQHAYSDPRALAATELMVRLLRERAAYEANLFDENNAFLLAASVFPYFYALVGERNPKLAPKQGPRSPYSPLACDAFELIRRDGPSRNQSCRKRSAAAFPWLRSTRRWASCSPSCASRASTTSPAKARSGIFSTAGRPTPYAKVWDCRCSRRSPHCSRNIWTA
jgi:hypothetical protein